MNAEVGADNRTKLCYRKSFVLDDPMLRIRYPSSHHPPKKQFPELFFFTARAFLMFKSCCPKKKNFSIHNYVMNAEVGADNRT